MPEQITMRELLADPIYRRWLTKKPELTTMGYSAPWRVYLQAEPRGPWIEEDFQKYSAAYTYLRDNLRTSHDLALSCKRQGFKPPIVKRSGVREYYIPRPLSDSDAVKPSHRHVWCPHCRRPTLFLWYKKHHAMSGYTVSPSDRRCRICGVRYIFIPKYERASDGR